MSARDLPLPFGHALRRRVAAALAAEVGHELQGPVNLFRMARDRLSRGEHLDEEDVSLLGEELERLSQLSGRLRELARAQVVRQACTPQQIVEAALVCRSGEAEAASQLGLELDVATGGPIYCDLGLLAQALRELIDNALEARAGRAGVRFHAGADGGFCVWDDGAGFELGFARASAWGVTTRPDAAGLGLSVALRAARAHGFGLELRRGPLTTEVWVTMPALEEAT